MYQISTRQDSLLYVSPRFGYCCYLFERRTLTLALLISYPHSQETLQSSCWNLIFLFLRYSQTHMINRVGTKNLCYFITHFSWHSQLSLSKCSPKKVLTNRLIKPFRSRPTCKQKKIKYLTSRNLS